MKEAKSTAAARKELDERFRKKWKHAARDKRPAQGWVREIREALGMSARQLAQLTGLKASTIAKIEQSERRDGVQLSTLRKLGKALHCELVYALVPRQPLDRILRDRAFGLLLPEILIPAKKLGMNLPTMIVTEIIDKLIQERKLLEKPHALWDESKRLNEMLQKVLATIPGRQRTAPAPSAPVSTAASPSPETTAPSSPVTGRAENDPVRAAALKDAYDALQELEKLRRDGKVQE